MMKICTVSQMRALDGRAVEEFGIKEELLMENAGEALYHIVSKTLGGTGKRFMVFCGIGNNGGDGLVVARKIHSNGGGVKVCVLGNPDMYKGAAKLNFDIVSRLPIEVCRLDTVQAVKNDVYHCDGIVDAVLGTGLTRDVGGLYRDVIELINGARNDRSKTVFSADIPSGVHGDTGKVMGAAVRADHTVTFGLPKIGNVLFPGYELAGQLYVTHISFPPSMYDNEGLKVEINRPAAFPPRKRGGHKGDFGKVLFIAGAPSYFGAPCFAALSFMKAGGGYARLAAPKSMIPFIADWAREVVFVPQMETDSGTISLHNKKALLTLSAAMDMVVIGPGLSLDAQTQQLVRELVREITRPLLIDGDGITAVCEHLETVARRAGETVLTPHLGEMSRLTGLSMEKIETDKIATVQQTAATLHAAIVLKGAHSLIGLPDGRVFINMTGNPGMATAGSGDVLAGTIPAALGLGLPIWEAVKKGVFIHGLSGDLAAEVKGEDGMTAQDILDYLPLALKMDREGLDRRRALCYMGAEVI
jgi:hydroxyethylthiazole kinase-like uncharacterized protein yjeF